MRRILLMPFAVLSLAGCAAAVPLAASAAGLPPSPQAAADKTVLDEQAGQATELAYKTFRLLVEVGVDGGAIKGPLAARLAAADGKAFAAIKVARAAYKAGNAADYLAALGQARAAIAEGIALVPAH